MCRGGGTPHIQASLGTPAGCSTIQPNYNIKYTEIASDSMGKVLVYKLRFILIQREGNWKVHMWKVVETGENFTVKFCWQETCVLKDCGIYKVSCFVLLREKTLDHFI